VPVAVVNDGGDCGANWVIRSGVGPADCVGLKVGVVPACMSDVSVSAPTVDQRRPAIPPDRFASSCVHQLKRSNQS
jgi:hypothetical protein